jgi:hypothetical protein
MIGSQHYRVKPICGAIAATSTFCMASGPNAISCSRAAVASAMSVPTSML